MFFMHIFIRGFKKNSFIRACSSYAIKNIFMGTFHMQNNICQFPLGAASTNEKFLRQYGTKKSNECEKLFVGWKVKIQFENKPMFQGVGPHSNPFIVQPRLLYFSDPNSDLEDWGEF